VSATILQRVATGDATAVQDCLSQYGDLVWALARRLLRNPSDAEDAVQDIFIDVWKNAGRYDPQVAAETTFITMIARRRIIDRCRRQSRAPEAAAVDVDQVASSSEANPLGHQLEVREEAERVRKCMAQLREDEQRVLDLSICQGLSQSEISDLLQMPLGTVKSHARRGMIRLRELLAEHSRDLAPHAVAGGAP